MLSQTERVMVQRATLAHLFDLSPGTIDRLVERGVIPQPYRPSKGIALWDVDDVRRAIKGMLDGAAGLRVHSSDADEAMQRMRDNARKTKGRPQATRRRDN